MSSMFVGRHVALFNHCSKQFVQMGEGGEVGVLEDAEVNQPGLLDSWRSWERFLVVDAGNRKVALHNPAHNRFIRVDGDDVNAYGGQRNANELPPEQDWPSERFTIVDAGNGKFAFHNSNHNRFIRLAGSAVDAKGGERDVDKLPPESEWAAERFEIVMHPEAKRQPIPADYEIIRHIAEGYWGKTFAAKSKVDGSIYCIKQFKKNVGQDVAIERELSALIALPPHANVLRYHHATVVDGERFIVCEYIESEQLIECMPEPHGSKIFNENNVLAYAQQIFEGLSHLHQSNPCIVHRDLHMGNILVKSTSDNKDADEKDADVRPGCIKIIDVGNSKVAQNRDLLTMTATGGHKCYFSPERIVGGQFNHKDDVWAAACIITELVTGKFISRRQGAGQDGVLFATPSCQALRNDVITEVRERSPKLGGVVLSIFSNVQPETRPSAAEVLGAWNEQKETFSTHCPITGEIMVDPVVCADGHSYERFAIEEWFARGGKLSPMTNAPLPNLNLIPNRGLKSLIDELEQNNQ